MKIIADGLVYGRGYINKKRIESGWTVPVVDHVPEVLEYHKITRIEAKNILLQLRGSYPAEIANGVIGPIIDFVEKWEPEKEYDIRAETNHLRNILCEFVQNECSDKNGTLLVDMWAKYIIPLGEHFQRFTGGLRCNFAERRTGTIVEIEIKNSLFPVIALFTTWCKDNREKLEIYGEQNPYRIILILVTGLFAEILKYFPDDLSINGIESGEIEKPSNDLLVNGVETGDIEKPSMASIAIYYIVVGKPLTANNANQIARGYGWTSGPRLLRHYKSYEDQDELYRIDSLRRSADRRVSTIEEALTLAKNDTERDLLSEAVGRIRRLHRERF